MDALAFGRGSSAAAKEVTESQERFFGGGPKAERMSNIGSPGLRVFHLRVSVRVQVHGFTLCTLSCA